MPRPLALSSSARVRCFLYFIKARQRCILGEGQYATCWSHFSSNHRILIKRLLRITSITLFKDTADAAGDLFFDMHNVFLEPFQCPNGAASGSHCSNPEATAPNLVVNKLVLNVDSRYSGYAKVRPRTYLFLKA